MRHGTMSGYKTHGCRCVQCRAANADYHRNRRNGVLKKVDAEPCRDHLRFLIDRHGLSMSNVAAMSGLDLATIQGIRHGEYRTVRPETADALLSVTAKDVPETGLIPRKRYERLVTEMRRAGLTLEQLEAMFGTKLDWYRPERMRGRTARRIVTLYRLLAREGLVPASALEDIA